MGRASGATYQLFSLSWELAQERWGEGVCFSSGWGAAASNAFGVSACQEEGDALNRLWTSSGLRKECWAWTPTAGFEGSLGHLLVWRPASEHQGAHWTTGVMISALPTPQSRNPCPSAWKPCKIGNGGSPVHWHCRGAVGGGLCSGTSLHTTDGPAGPVPGPWSGMVKDNFWARGTEAHFRRWRLVT